MRELTLQEANQNFSACIAEVEAGERLILTREGEPIAELVPYTGNGREKKPDPKKEAARKRLLALMDAGYDWGGPYTYDERTER